MTVKYARLGTSDLDESQHVIELNIVDDSGKHVSVGTEPSAKAAQVATLPAMDVQSPTTTAAQAAGDTPTKAEFDALVADVSSLKTTLDGLKAFTESARTAFNDLIASLKAAGLMDSD